MARVKNKLNWEAITIENRTSAIDKVKDAINKIGGYIINFNIYSDLAISLTIEIEEQDILDLHTELNKHIKISNTELENLNKESKQDWWILLNISFSTGKGNLKKEIPNVPG